MKNNTYYKVIKDGFVIQFKKYNSSEPRKLTKGSLIFSGEPQLKTVVYDGMPVTKKIHDSYITILPYKNGNFENSCWTNLNTIPINYLKEISKKEYDKISKKTFEKKLIKRYNKIIDF